MGYDLRFGPIEYVAKADPPDTPEIDETRFDVLVSLAEDAGYLTYRRGNEVQLQGDFEEFSFGRRGGWLSKPSHDEDEFDRQWQLVTLLCDEADWAVFDPQLGKIVYPPED